MKELREFVEVLPEEIVAILGQGLGLVQKETLKLHKDLAKVPRYKEALAVVDRTLDLLKGKGDTPGLLQIFGVKEPGDPEDPSQEKMDLPDRDLRTHAMNTDGVRELVSGLVADKTPMEAFRALNLLEEGEREREGGPRESVLKVIRSAREPIAKRVRKLTVEDGGATANGS